MDIYQIHRTDTRCCNIPAATEDTTYNREVLQTHVTTCATDAKWRCSERLGESTKFHPCLWQRIGRSGHYTTQYMNSESDNYCKDIRVFPNTQIYLPALLFLQPIINTHTRNIYMCVCVCVCVCKYI